MNKFAAKNLDYQIGIITTDTRPIDPTAANPAFPNDPNNWGQDSCLVHSGAHPKIVTPADIDPAASVAANEQLGNFGSTYAQGRDAIKNALSLPRLSGCNSGFLRSDAFLAIVSFTDSDDGVGGASIPVAYNPAGYPAYTHNVTASGGSITQPSDLLSFLDTIKTAIPISGGGVSRSYLMSSIVADDLASAACVTLQTNQPMYLLQPGTSWMNLSNTTYGTKASICDATLIANGLDTISEKILEATTAVQLSQVPDVSSITISLNGIPIGQDPNNGWTFEALTNRIIFHGSAIPSGAGVTISVNYKPNDVVR
jgi:hypothetical protein